MNLATNLASRLPPAAAAARIGRVGNVTGYVIDTAPALADCIRLLALPNGHSILGIWTALVRFAETTCLPGWLIDDCRGMDVATLARKLGADPSMMATACAELEAAGVLDSRTITYQMMGLRTFLREACVREQRGWVPVWRLRALYENWCHKAGRGPLSIAEFRKAMFEAGFREGRSRRGGSEDGTRPNVQLRSWEGLRERKFDDFVTE